jgi:hypothetical protein
VQVNPSFARRLAPAHFSGHSNLNRYPGCVGAGQRANAGQTASQVKHWLSTSPAGSPRLMPVKSPIVGSTDRPRRLPGTPRAPPLMLLRRSHHLFGQLLQHEGPRRLSCSPNFQLSTLLKWLLPLRAPGNPLSFQFVADVGAEPGWERQYFSQSRFRHRPVGTDEYTRGDGFLSLGELVVGTDRACAGKRPLD